MIKEKYGRTLLKIGLRFHFGIFTKFLKLIASQYRYYSMILAGRTKFKNHTSKNIILICALPKSGSTWLETILSNEEYYLPLMPTEVTIWEQKYGRSDNFIPSVKFFENIPKGRWIIKIHAHKSTELIELVRKTPNVKLVVLSRQINDVLKSQLRYSDKTKYHPDFRQLKKLKQDSKKLNFIIGKYKTDYSKWILDWKKSSVPNSVVVEYEDLIKNPLDNFSKLFSSLKFNISDSEIEQLLKKYSKSNMSKLSLNKEFYTRNL